MRSLCDYRGLQSKHYRITSRMKINRSLVTLVSLGVIVVVGPSLTSAASNGTETEVTTEIKLTTATEEATEDEDDTEYEEETDSKEATETEKNTTMDTYPTQFPEGNKCSEMIGQYVNGKWEGLEVKYDLMSILESHGGAPGKVKAKWTEKKDAPVGNATDVRPLPYADEEFRIYKYGSTDWKTYARMEHAVRRFSGTPKAFLEIRGKIYWAPEDFCEDQYLRTALYYVDDRGFTFDVSREYCSIGTVIYTCKAPAQCYAREKGHILGCSAGRINSIGNLAALIGGSI